MDISELDYHLPQELLATRPAEPRDSARLMVVHRSTGRIEHLRVRDLPGLATGPGRDDLMLFNQTRVLKAKFQGVRRNTGGKVGGLFLTEHDNGEWDVLLESRGTLGPGDVIDFAGDINFELIKRVDAGQWTVRPNNQQSAAQILEQIGQTPLPPYIVKERRKQQQADVTSYDDQRYNTVFAQTPGSVAAPTAGLHFTSELLSKFDHGGVARAMVTLNVGIGTFAAIKTQRVEDHPIHAEYQQVPGETIRAIMRARQQNKRIFVVGTTTVRAVESLPTNWMELDQAGYASLTSLLITPGFEFRFTDCLMTNFHLPRSSLLALVASLPGVGIGRLMSWYQTAIKEGYRFYSYGDAMLIL
jgi:S-adenosylmethionine:tRNA ribosyltransferase-isomerase